MSTGVVILNYHSYALTKELVMQLSSFSTVNNVIIVDNNSGDDFASLAESEDKIHFIANKENGGYAKGNNLGLKYLYEEKKCDIAFIANPDVIVPEETISKIVSFFERQQ